jgi:hypothetical protein
MKVEKQHNKTYFLASTVASTAGVSKLKFKLTDTWLFLLFCSIALREASAAVSWAVVLRSVFNEEVTGALIALDFFCLPPHDLWKILKPMPLVGASSLLTSSPRWEASKIFCNATGILGFPEEGALEGPAMFECFA